MVAWCRQLVESSRFQKFVLAIIIASALLLGLETDRSLTSAYPLFFNFVSSLIIGIFTVEIACRLIAEWPRPWRFFWSGWNVFDFLIVVACYIPEIGPATAVLRLFRVLRAMRLVTMVPELRIIVTAMIKALPSVVYVFMLLFLHFYIFAVLGVFFWGKNDPGHFGTLPLAFLTLFRVLTQEDWTDVMYTQMWGRDLYPPQGWDQSGINESHPILGALFFVAFIMIGGMVILNLFVGVIIGSMTDVQRLEAERAREAAAKQPPEPSAEPVDKQQVLKLQMQEMKHALESLQTQFGRLQQTVADGS